jgi:hypothetical protein
MRHIRLNQFHQRNGQKARDRVLRTTANFLELGRESAIPEHSTVSLTKKPESSGLENRPG